VALLPCIEIEPRHPADAAVIWLHGLGANGHDFEPIVPELKLPEDLAIRFVFPHAPSIPVTINGGLVMPAWYDILSLEFGREIDEPQILRSAAAVTSLIDREIERGIASERIVIAGFSQGGAVALHAALTDARPLAGLMGLSTYLATQKILSPHPANKNLPVHLFHGIHDPVVPEALGRHALEALRSWGYQPLYETYPMEHAVCGQEIVDISRWLQQCLQQDTD
jgi:phospholipase/carboxylesterase